MNEPLSDFGRLAFETAHAMNQSTLAGIDAGRMGAQAEIERLRKALLPFVLAYVKAADEIGDSDLYPEQPRSVAVTLGDCRKAHAVLNYLRPYRPSDIPPGPLKGNDEHF